MLKLIMLLVYQFTDKSQNKDHRFKPHIRPSHTKKPAQSGC